MYGVSIRASKRWHWNIRINSIQSEVITMGSKEIKNPKEQPQPETTKNEQSTVDEAVRKAFQEGYKTGFADGFDSANELAEENELSDEE
jgi:flagellar biosynthesis/type III secretory pathway protein FliH